MFKTNIQLLVPYGISKNLISIAEGTKKYGLKCVVFIMSNSHHEEVKW